MERACSAKATAAAVLAPVTPTMAGTLPSAAVTTVSTAARRSSSVSV